MRSSRLSVRVRSPGSRLAHLGEALRDVNGRNLVGVAKHLEGPEGPPRVVRGRSQLCGLDRQRDQQLTVDGAARHDELRNLLRRSSSEALRITYTPDGQSALEPFHEELQARSPRR